MDHDSPGEGKRRLRGRKPQMNCGSESKGPFSQAHSWKGPLKSKDPVQSRGCGSLQLDSRRERAGMSNRKLRPDSERLQAKAFDLGNQQLQE